MQSFIAIVRRQGDFYNVSIPDVLEVTASGQMFGEAVAAASRALSAHAAARRETGLPMPSPRTLDEILELPEQIDEPAFRRTITVVFY